MAEVMEKHGLTDGALIEKYLKPLMKATRTQYFHHKGKVKDRRTLKAHDTRVAALDMAFRVKGSYAPMKTENKNSEAVSVIVLDVPRPNRPTQPPNEIEVIPTISANNGHST